MKISLLICALLAASVATARTTVFRLEVQDNNRSYILGADDTRREVVVISPTEYQNLTSTVGRISRGVLTRRERERVYGEIVKIVIDEERRTKTEHHESGYIHTESLKVKSVQKPTELKRKIPKVERIGRESKRKLSYIEALEELKKKPVRGATIVRDATTGTEVER